MTIDSAHNLKALVALIVIALCLSACSDGGGGDRSSGSSCDIAQQNRFVHGEMLDRYYWYRQVPDEVDYDRFDSPQQLLDFLRYTRYDRFSYITSQSEFEDLLREGTYIGYGFSYVIESFSSVRIRFVYQQSAAGYAGIRRGDEVLEINGQDVVDIIAANSWNQVFGEAEIGLPLSIKLRRSSGLVETLNLVKDRVVINAVLHSEVIDIAGGDDPSRRIIGYLVFNSFLSTSLAELDAVFQQFRLDGVNELILDLRYNGGGSVEVARRLASFIHRSETANRDVFAELRYNDRYQADNIKLYFEPEPSSLGVDELTVISTEMTCSASELVVVALQPYFTRVTTIGGRSCGKPVGMNPVNFCDKTLLAVNFASYNASGSGEFFDGLAADCPAVDDVSRDFGDPLEAMLRAAKYYVDNRVCEAVAARPLRPAGGLRGLQAISGAI